MADLGPWNSCLAMIYSRDQQKPEPVRSLVVPSMDSILSGLNYWWPANRRALAFTLLARLLCLSLAWWTWTRIGIAISFAISHWWNHILWLVVWLPSILFSHEYWVSNHPNWRAHIFQRRGPTTNQFSIPRNWIVKKLAATARKLFCGFGLGRSSPNCC